MNTEELLKPRYKVIAGWPGNFGYKIGEILYCSSELRQERGAMAMPSELSKYPHLFRKLEWWEERSERDIKVLKYVKDFGGRVYEILTWCIDGNVINAGITVRPFIIHVPHLLPSTETEYLNRLNDKQ